MSKNKVELGDEVRDVIGGLQGIVTSHAKCLTGCDRVTVRGKVGKDGKLGEEYWFDIDAVKIITKQKIKPVSVQSVEKPGGPPTKSTLKKY